MVLKNVNGYENLYEKFKAKERRVTQNGCWEILQANCDCYSRITFDGKGYAMHRVSYEFHKGKIGMGKIICHICNNKRCFNPDHLYEGTKEDNARDITNDMKRKYPNGKRPKKNFNLK